MTDFMTKKNSGRSKIPPPPPVTFVVVRPLSAAFGTVDHKILIERLSSFGMTGTVLKWFSSYLTNRSQRIALSGSVSNSFPLPQEVAQGSFLGPLLFSIYASKLFQVIEKHLLDVHAYADDAQLYLSFEPDNVVGQAAALDAMQRCIRDERSWMIMEKLKINDVKTEFMIDGTRHQFEKVNIDHLTIGDTRVSSVTGLHNIRRIIAFTQTLFYFSFRSLRKPWRARSARKKNNTS